VTVHLAAAGLRAAAEAWLAEDPDPDTRAELTAVLAEGDDAGLRARFGARLQFGTAGLRGPLGAGPNRMNRALVRRAAAGLGAWLSAGVSDRLGGVAVGFDARHRSAAFAEDTAAVLAAAGIDVHLLPEPLPTPVLAFAVRHLGAAAGVMVTASHNPAADNGYKVYDHTGGQIVPPADAEISAAIDAVGPLAGVALADRHDPRIHRLGRDLVEAYLAAVTAMLPGRPAGGVDLEIAYTALHGVGGAVVTTLLQRAGFPAVHAVAQQQSPDPDFPTVAFPNPEEPGALDLALAEARRVRADVVLANDPDADRLAVAVPDPGAEGGWRALRGDEVGALLADAVLDDLAVVPPAAPDRPPVLATSIVSSRLLSAMAADAGVAYADTLTGFKWIARVPGPDRRLLFGYEEALGYCVGDLVADKDGISALLAVAQRMVALRARGTSVAERLDHLARRHGVHATRQRSFRLEGEAGLARITETMARMRAAPPDPLGRWAVTAVDDLLDPANRLGLPPSDVVLLGMDGARVVVRPSGTEPKLKCYLEAIRPVAAGDGNGVLAAARAASGADLDRLEAALTGWLGLR